MIQTMTEPKPKYIATVRGSREVTLFGTADLAFWEKKLAGENLRPYAVDGKAEIMVSAVASRYMGLRFSEFIVAITVSQEIAGERAGAFLLSACTTSRLFAFMERNLFQTPYTHAPVEVQCGDRTLLQLSAGKDQIFRAERKGRTTRTTEDVVWEGPIYLPNPDKNQPSKTRMFARLSGDTEICPFVEGDETAAILPTAMDPTFGWLVESAYSPKEWHVRQNATHARSKTYARN